MTGQYSAAKYFSSIALAAGLLLPGCGPAIQQTVEPTPIGSVVAAPSAPSPQAAPEGQQQGHGSDLTQHVEISLLVAEATKNGGQPYVLNPSSDVLDHRVDFSQIKGDENVCLGVYQLTSDGQSASLAGGPLGYGCVKDDVINFAMDIEQSGNDIPVAYVVGHEEKGAFAPGLAVGQEEYATMEIGPYLALQNDDVEGDPLLVNTVTAGDTIAQVHYLNPSRQKNGNPEARTGGYSSLLFTLVEPMDAAQLAKAKESLKNDGISAIVSQVVLAEQTGNGTYHLDAGVSVLNALKIGGASVLKDTVTDNRGVATIVYDADGKKARSVPMDTVFRTPLAQTYVAAGAFPNYDKGSRILPLQQFSLNLNLDTILIPMGLASVAVGSADTPTVPPPTGTPPPTQTPPPLPTPTPTPKVHCENGVGLGNPDDNCNPPGLAKKENPAGNPTSVPQNNDDVAGNLPGSPGNQGGDPSGGNSSGGNNSGGGQGQGQGQGNGNGGGNGNGNNP